MREALLSVIQDESRILTERIDEKYLSDNLGRRKGTAGAVVFPLTTEEVSGILRYAWSTGIPVTPRGAGTNLVGSTIPTEYGIVLDLSRMNRILELDEETFTATVEPGVVLEDFQAYVEKRGFFYPPDPGEKTATIGGNVSTNAGGMRAVKYGVTRNYVMALELVLADGTILWAGSKNRKDTTGLDLKEMVIGSEGTLAVITKCVLKLLPKPEESLSVLLSYDSLRTGIGSVRKIIQANLNPTAIEFIERKVVQLGEDYLGLEFPNPEAAAYLLLTFDGSHKEIGQHLEGLTRVAMENGALSVLPLSDPELSARVWRIRGILVKGVEAVSEQEPLDIVVPINQVDTFVNFVNQYEQECGMRMISFGHAGDGNVHLCVVRGDRDEETWDQELDRNLTVLYDKAKELGGLISGEHGIGMSTHKLLVKVTDPETLALMRRVKRAFDERNLLNRGISYNV
ncbi:MAG: FAD-binding oxidoreductase [Lachnospiraceae bacterium]|nr:FAD-binding oxidoreductase [Lachnospiraceae bacterium]